jgi:hypothetical protein
MHAMLAVSKRSQVLNSGNFSPFEDSTTIANMPKRGKPSMRGKKKRGGQMTGRRLMQEMQSEVGRRLSQQRMTIWSSGSKPPPVMRTTKGPRQGAALTERFLINSFTLETGLTGGFVIAPTPTTSLFGQIAFEAQDLPQSADYFTIFDQYRVDRLQFRISPQINSISATTASPNAVVPRLFVVVDRDDATVPTTLSQLREYDNVQDILPYEGITIDFEPSATPAVYQAGAFSGYAVASSGELWMDAASTAVPFYGIKFGCDPTTTGATAAYNWYVDCYVQMSFKNTR